MPVYVETGSERIEENRAVKIGRGWIVSRLHDVLPPNGRLVAADAAQVGAEELRKELQKYRIGDDPGPLMIALGLAVQKNWSGILGVKTFGGPRAPTELERRARKMFTDALDRARQQLVVAKGQFLSRLRERQQAPQEACCASRCG